MDPRISELIERGIDLRSAGHLASAETLIKDGLAEYPRSAALHFMLAAILLQGRRYSEAWPFYEARRALTGAIRPPATRAPEWRGEELANKKIVVCAEQGIGDQIMFARFVPELRARGAEVVLLGDPRTLGRFFDAAGFCYLPWWADRAFPDCDYWAPIASLPLRLGSVRPADARYISRSSFATPSARIGVMPATNTRGEWATEKSPPKEVINELLKIGVDLRPEATGAFDFWATAEILSRLRLVITIDTAVAHVAGALGVPCWVLLPYRNLDWRWNDGHLSDWYPEAHLFRQPARGEWGAVLDAVRRALGA